MIQLQSNKKRLKWNTVYQEKYLYYYKKKTVRNYTISFIQLMRQLLQEMLQHLSIIFTFFPTVTYHIPLNYKHLTTFTGFFIGNLTADMGCATESNNNPS